MTNIAITVNDAEVKTTLALMRKRLGDTRPVMHEIGQHYERRVLENFGKEQAPDGTPWAKLSAVTLAMGLLRKRGFGKSGALTVRGKMYLQNKKLLVESGRLRSRIHYQAGASSVRIGVTGIKYAAIHQFGGKTGRGRKVTIPARPYLAMNQGSALVLAPRDREMLLDILRGHIAAAFEK